MIKKIILYIIISTPLLTYSQNCSSSCTWAITGADTSAYTIGSGQTLCINENAVVKGKITLQGGEICIREKGVLSTSVIICQSGVINNYGTVMNDGSISMTTPGFTFNNNQGATFNILGELTISNETVSLSNQGSVNITGSIILSAGSITNSGTMNYSNINKTGGANTNTGTVNCCILGDNH